MNAMNSGLEDGCGKMQVGPEEWRCEREDQWGNREEMAAMESGEDTPHFKVLPTSESHFYLIPDLLL